MFLLLFDCGKDRCFGVMALYSDFIYSYRARMD